MAVCAPASHGGAPTPTTLVSSPGSNTDTPSPFPQPHVRDHSLLQCPPTPSYVPLTTAPVHHVHLLSIPDPAFFPNHASARRSADFVSTAIEDLLASGAITPWTPSPSSPRPTVISPLSVATRASGAQRLCIDLRYVNEHLQYESFKYESLSMLSDILSPNDQIFNFDLKSGMFPSPPPLSVSSCCSCPASHPLALTLLPAPPS